MIGCAVSGWWLACKKLRFWCLAENLSGSMGTFSNGLTGLKIEKFHRPEKQKKFHRPEKQKKNSIDLIFWYLGLLRDKEFWHVVRYEVVWKVEL